jgi:branched-chain amino acid transport system ATP-binding protein
MLEVEHLEVGYGEVAVLRDLSLNICKGEIVTLVGGNGAGKTTLRRAICGQLRPHAGTIRFQGSAITRLSPDRIVARGIAQVPEGRHVFPELSVEDNLLVGGHLLRKSRVVREELKHVYTMFPRLEARRKQTGGTLSGGEQQMLVLGRAMMSRPRLLLLDEPSLGLAPRIVEDVARTILAFRAAGMTILLVEQNARVALAIADRGYVIETGRIVLADSAAALKGNPKIVESYLGGAYASIASKEAVADVGRKTRDAGTAQSPTPATRVQST